MAVRRRRQTSENRGHAERTGAQTPPSPGKDSFCATDENFRKKLNPADAEYDYITQVVLSLNN